VRTGIHMGEVSERPGSDGDVEGLAVDLAARIAGVARPAASRHWAIRAMTCRRSSSFMLNVRGPGIQPL
jgi:class 3 adenylate cyclase